MTWQSKALAAADACEWCGQYTGALRCYAKDAQPREAEASLWDLWARIDGVSSLAIDLSSLFNDYPVSRLGKRLSQSCLEARRSIVAAIEACHDAQHLHARDLQPGPPRHHGLRHDVRARRGGSREARRGGAGMDND